MTLAVFQSDPKAPYHARRPVSLFKLLRQGELPAVIFGALRDAPDGPDTRELTGICLKQRDLDTDDIVLRRSMGMKICNTLDKLRIRGGIEKAGMRAGVIVWRVLSGISKSAGGGLPKDRPVPICDIRDNDEVIRQPVP